MVLAPLLLQWNTHLRLSQHLSHLLNLSLHLHQRQFRSLFHTHLPLLSRHQQLA